MEISLHFTKADIVEIGTRLDVNPSGEVR